MKKTYLLPAVFLAISVPQNSDAQKPASDKKTNIIFILADDLGYGDLGCYGQKKIKTPNNDQLAANGMRFTQHYSGAPVCAPSRCVMLTGKHMGHVYIRGKDEWAEGGKVWDYLTIFADSTLESQRPLPVDLVTFQQLLHKADYKTGIVGKWGLGAPNTNNTPLFCRKN